jgi:hypothetical protein
VDRPQQEDAAPATSDMLFFIAAPCVEATRAVELVDQLVAPLLLARIRRATRRSHTRQTTGASRRVVRARAVAMWRYERRIRAFLFDQAARANAMRAHRRAWM